MKRFIPLLFCILCLSAPLSAQASSLSSPIYSGYTQDGIYFEVYTTDKLDCYVINSTITTIYITYDGYVYPSPSYTYTKTINGIRYIGMLKLQSYTQADGKTTAKYSGYLNPIN